ncbi:MAG TPA: hypothetical protein VGO57_18920 [Verrucomicrobiae bacterium]|jgi:hypothetical protein
MKKDDSAVGPQPASSGSMLPPRPPHSVAIGASGDESEGPSRGVVKIMLPARSTSISTFCYNDMPALRITRLYFASILAIGFALCAAGMAVFLRSQVKSGLEDLSLVWYLVFIAVPWLSLSSFIGMFRVRAGSVWWVGLGLLLLLPQLLVWFMAVAAIFDFI